MHDVKVRFINWLFLRAVLKTTHFVGKIKKDFSSVSFNIFAQAM